MSDTELRRRGRICPHGDDTCPCQDGDACHYESYNDEPMRCPTSGIIGCRGLSRNEAIHLHFELSYAGWLVLPRVALQSMPDDWQHRFVALIAQLADRAEAEGVPIDLPGGYTVDAQDDVDERQLRNLSQYERGRRRLW